MQDAIIHLGMVILGEYLRVADWKPCAVGHKKWQYRCAHMGTKGNFFWQVDTPVTIVPADHTPWSLGQGDIPLTDWFACVTFNQAVLGLKPAKALCVIPKFGLAHLSNRQEPFGMLILLYSKKNKKNMHTVPTIITS